MGRDSEVLAQYTAAVCRASLYKPLPHGLIQAVTDACELYFPSDDISIRQAVIRNLFDSKL